MYMSDIKCGAARIWIECRTTLMLSEEDRMCYSSSHQQVSKGQSIKRLSQLGNGHTNEWEIQDSTEFLIQSKQDYIYLFEIGFNTEFHPSSCAFPQLSGQILERAIEGRKGPLSTLQMGYFLLIPRETSHSHNLARNSISCVKTPPGVFFQPKLTLSLV